MIAAALVEPQESYLSPWQAPGSDHPLHRVFGRLAGRGGRNHYMRVLRRVLTAIECPDWEPAYRTEPLPITESDVYTYPWEDLSPPVADEGLRPLRGTGTYNLATTVLRLVVREYLRTIDDQIEQAEDLIEALLRRPERAEAAETLHGERLRLRHQRRGLRLTQDNLEGRNHPRSEEPAGRVLSTDELEMLFRACEGDSNEARGRRQAAMIVLLLVVRRFELARLDLANVDVATGSVVVRKGKGGKTATTWIPDQGLPALHRWIEIRGDEPGSFLRMSYLAIYRQIGTLARRAEVAPFTPHDLRRTACTGLLAAGVKAHLVQKQMRHADFGTTQRYDHSQAEEVRRAVARLPVPCAR